MKWLVNCINNLYSSSCTNDLTTVLPPIDRQELSPVTLVDCRGCTKPCAHPPLPPDLNIDQSKPLQNTVPPYAIHLLIMTGKTNWQAHIENEGLAHTLIEAVRRRKGTDKRPFENRYHPAFTDNDQSQRVIITNCSLPTQYSTRGNDILLLPDNIILSNITPRRVDALLDYIFGKPCFQAFSTYPFPYSNLILICGHGNKDKRCGTIGPILLQNLEQASALADETTKLALVSHLGGHAFAGNLVVYTHHGYRAIWYGRVTPCYCKDIVENTLEGDKVVENLVRGVFEVKSKPNKCQEPLEW
ncbi:Altered inheritance of mitochondria protein 32 [Choanephora cucurbitarum]|uniref:Altered inheritance of mitochondria protein 32 n=1 Tax=Choanephora cucurbitarum TaxID=101091 RepID=A0A1C7NE28_9FUNG|nr:Altered inheritance of mitochondria protein 32 [Choanephora cucurbitarum]